MSEIKVGDRVRFRAGKGYSEGRVTNIGAKTAMILTAGSKYVSRRLEKCERIDAVLVPMPAAVREALTSGRLDGETIAVESAIAEEA